MLFKLQAVILAAKKILVCQFDTYMYLSHVFKFLDSHYIAI